MSQTQNSEAASEAPAPAGQQAPVQFASPDEYQLSGRGISVTYHPIFVGGEPSLTYEDRHRTLGFRGDQIRRVDVPDLGTLVSVTLAMTTDSGSTTFSILLPRINLPSHTGASVPISTEGVTTVHRLSAIPALNQGQRDIYSVTSLTGTASLVIIPL